MKNQKIMSSDGNLVINGGAESGMEGWVSSGWVVGNTVNHSGGHAFGTTVGSGSAAWMTQHVNVVKGATYTIVYWSTDKGANTVNLFIDGVLIVSSHATGGYTSHYSNFVANSDVIELNIQANTQVQEV